MNETEAYLALNLVPGIGSLRIRKLLEYFETPQSILKQSSSQLQAVEGIGQKTASQIANWEKQGDLSKELSLAKEMGVEIISLADAHYPRNLREIHDAPIILYIQGKLKEADNHALAIVGSRSCSHYGREAARKIGFQLAQSGLTVISGLARGIDTAAHEGALAANNKKGRTIAILGSGLAQLYPEENQVLANHIINNGQGAIISEFPLQMPPSKSSFPQRNRVVSGWSSGVLVIESPLRSGSLITAGQAAEQGRPVYAVPGPINRPGSMGCNQLIKDGARLVTDAGDILQDLSLEPNYQAPEMKTALPELDGLSEQENLLYKSIGDGEDIPIDQIMRNSGLSSQETSVNLMKLEMKKLVKQLPGQRFVKLTR